MNVTSLNADGLKTLKKAVLELSDSMIRAQSEKELQKETIDRISEELDIDKKIIRQIAKTYFDANFNQKTQEHKEFEESYQLVIDQKL